jgi:alpha-tubulin suppressor-like RCC1 family protein
MTIVGALSVALMIGMVTSATPSTALPGPDDPPRIRFALAWGDNYAGQVGDGTQAMRTSPARPLGLDDGVSQVAAGEGHTLAVRDPGTVLAWGKNTDGQLGDGTLDAHLIPLPVATLTGVTKVSAGLSHSLALKSNGTVWAWGDNSKGQLGNGTDTDRRRPVQVSILTGVTEIAAGNEFNLARRLDGTVWAWGSNSRGQLGDGTQTPRSRPVKVVGLTNIVQIAAGSSHSMAVRSDGVAFGWGDNEDGEIGDGTVDSRVVPGQVRLVTGVITRVAAGSGFTVAVVDGRLYWWGVWCAQSDRDTGLCFADPTPQAERIPLSGVTHITAGRYHALAILSDGTLWSWRSNRFGQLGDGTTTLRISPVQVLGANGTVMVDAGASHTVVVVDRHR